MVGCGGDSPAADNAVAKAAAPSPAASASPDADRTGPKGDAPAADKPGVTDQGDIVSAVEWFHGSLEEALAAAKSSGKLVFVDVGAYWCPPCHRLDEEVFTQADVGEALGNGYIALHIDAEKGEGPELAERYKVQAFPTMLVLEPSGVEKGRIVDYLPPKELLAALSRLAAGGNVLATLLDDVEAHPDDVGKQYRLGHAYALAARRDDALKIFDAVLVADPKNELGFASKVAYDQALFITHKLDGKDDDAIAQFRALQERYPDSKEATRAYGKIGRLLNRQGRADEAIAELDKMLATAPDDVGLHSSYGWFSFRQKCKPARGLEVVLAGIALDESRAGLHYLAAELRLATDDPQGALASIKQASALEPDSNYYKRQIRRFAAAGAKAG